MCVLYRAVFGCDTVKKMAQLQALVANLSTAAEEFTTTYKVRPINASLTGCVKGRVDWSHAFFFQTWQQKREVWRGEMSGPPFQVSLEIWKKWSQKAAWLVLCRTAGVVAAPDNCNILLCSSDV